LENETSKKQFEELLSCLEKLNDTNIIFTLSNSDTGGRIINSMIQSFVNDHSSNTKSFTSMGQLNYFSTLQFVDGIVGNSSSGLLEAPTFRVGTVNIGDRQKGRIKAKSVIDCEPKKKSIQQAVDILYSKAFQNILPTIENPYGKGNASEKIMEILQKVKIPEQLKKEFYNL
jgi:GDP/UDP-N,N'-diacetylbacillosamine 2-epimerase (hydrolysing)